MKPVVIRKISPADAAVVHSLKACDVLAAREADGHPGLIMRFPVQLRATSVGGAP